LLIGGTIAFGILVFGGSAGGLSIVDRAVAAGMAVAGAAFFILVREYGSR
jgi:hypothetical protein